MATDYSQVLTYRYPGKTWSMADSTYESLDWLDDSPKPTKEALDAEWDSVQAEIQAELLAKETAVSSAIAKLTRLGLTEQEARAIAGL